MDIVESIMQAIQEDPELMRTLAELVQNDPQIMEMVRKREEKQDKLQERELYYRDMERKNIKANQHWTGEGEKWQHKE